MAMKSYKPTSPGIRFRTGLTFQELSGDKPLKRLTKGKTGTGGRGAGPERERRDGQHRPHSHGDGRGRRSGRRVSGRE